MIQPKNYIYNVISNIVFNFSIRVKSSTSFWNKAEKQKRLLKSIDSKQQPTATKTSKSWKSIGDLSGE